MSVLLRQPHGFEGSPLRQVGLEVRDLSIAKPPDVDLAICGLRTTCLSFSDLSHDHDGHVSCIDCFLDLYVPIEHRGELTEQVLCRLASANGGYVRKTTSCSPLELGIRNLVSGGESSLKASLVESFIASPNDLHVLLRHRPRSIPQAQEPALVVLTNALPEVLVPRAELGVAEELTQRLAVVG